MNKLREQRDDLAEQVDFVAASVDKLEVETGKCVRARELRAPVLPSPDSSSRASAPFCLSRLSLSPPPLLFSLSPARSLRHVEEELRSIAEKQDTNVGALVDLVNENEEVLRGIKGKLKQTFVQTMLTVSAPRPSFCGGGGG